MEAFLRSIIESSFDGLYVVDAAGTGIMANSACLRITGISEQEFVGRNVSDALSNGIISDSVALKVLETKKPVTQIIAIREKEVLLTGSPILDQKGNVTHVVGNVRDIGQLNHLNIQQLLSIALQQRRPSRGKEVKPPPKRPYIQGIVAESKNFIEVVSLAQKVAKVDSTILIRGESGTGKEVIVNLIHSASNRAQGPLIKVNCSAIPHHLLESELFGYEKGAFTGADSRGKPGLFELANKGTIFLDEIGDMPMELQSKLLRVLQELEITRVGGRSSMKINVRVISATHKPLEQMVAEGKFRQDLFYRLNIVPIKIPPLRERKEDITSLAYAFLHRINAKYNLDKRLHPSALQVMKVYEWPGNIREMENMMERIAVTLDHDEIHWSDLPIISEHVKEPKEHTLKHLIQDVEKQIIYEKMAEYKSTRKAAKALGISQPALVKKLQKYSKG